MQNLPLDAKQYLGNQWQGKFRSSVGLGLGSNAPFTPLVRVQLSMEYTRLWAINFGPITTDGGATWEVGASNFPLNNGRILIKWGTNAAQETVEMTYPMTGGVVYVNASFLEVSGLDGSTEPLVPANYFVWVQEAQPGAQAGRARWTLPSFRATALGVGIAFPHTFFRPRRAVAFQIFAAEVGAATPPVVPPGLIRITELDAAGVVWNVMQEGIDLGFGTGSTQARDIYALSPNTDRIEVMNLGAAGSSMNITILWLLDLG